jgi:hypothetical protein
MKLDPEHLPRIGRQVGPTGGAPVHSRGQGGEGKRPTQAAKAAPDDGLALTPEASRFRALLARLQSLPEPTPSERVAVFQVLFATGAYRLDGVDIAGAMLADGATASALGFPPSR